MDKKNHRIAIFFPSFNIGGVERVMITLANSLNDINIKLIVIVTQKKGELLNLLNCSIPIIDLSCRLKRAILPLRKVIKKNKIDFIISGPNFCNYTAILASIGTNCKVIATQHCYDNIEGINLGFIYNIDKYLMGLIYNKSKNIIAITPGIRDYLLDKGVKNELIKFIPNPVDKYEIINKSQIEISELFDTRKPYLIFVGRLSVVKNIELLLKAFQIVLKDKKDINLLICGDGPERIKLELMAEKYGINKNVQFLGSISNPYPYIKHASTLVLPSYSEALPTIIIESLMLNIPVITTPTNGAVEILGKDYPGLLTGFESVDELAELINKNISNFEINNSNIIKLQKYDPVIVAMKYLKLIET